jgi:hypothetical protein
VAISRMGIKSKSLSVAEKLIIVKKVDHVTNVSRTKIAEELGNSVRMVTDKMHEQSDTGESVLRLPQITQILHTCVISSQKIKRKWKF